MVLTRDFKQTIQARVRRDPDFRAQLLQEGMECLLAGDLATGKAVLRDVFAGLCWRDGRSYTRSTAETGSHVSRSSRRRTRYQPGRSSTMPNSTPACSGARKLGA